MPKYQSVICLLCPIVSGKQWHCLLASVGMSDLLPRVDPLVSPLLLKWLSEMDECQDHT